LRYRLPLAEIVVDFYDRIKTISSGYASFDYDEAGMDVCDVVKLDLRLNGEPVDALCVICDRSKAEGRARRLTQKLKEKIDRQNFEVVIQAAIGSKILARERIGTNRMPQQQTARKHYTRAQSGEIGGTSFPVHPRAVALC
jgi:GTP-binding protein LepA